MKVVVREAYPSDLPNLIKLARKTFEESFAADNTPENMTFYINEAFHPDKLRREMEEAGSRYFVAEISKTLVGYARVRHSDEVKDQISENSIELQRIYVDKDYQRLKIGVSLLQTCIAYAKDQGFDWIWLGVWENNLKALAFYKKWGFEKFGNHIFQMGDDPQTDWLMKKRII